MSRARARTVALVVSIAAVRHRVEVRRRRAHPQLLLAALVSATAGTIAVVGWLPLPVYGDRWPVPGAYYYGTVVADEPATVRALVREFAATATVGAAALALVGALASDDWAEPPTEVVTAVSLPAAADGVLLEELLECSWFLAPLSVGGALAFAAGTGDPVTLVGALVGATAIALSGLLVGTAAGVAARAGLRRVPRLYAARLAIGSLLLFATFAALAVSRTAGSALAGTPLAWYGDLVLATAPGAGADPVRALAALALTGALALASLAIVRRIVRSLWLGEPISEDVTVDGTIDRSRRNAALERLLGRPTVAVVRTTWRRLRRSPRAMLYVALPLGFVGPVAVEVAVRSPGLVPVLLTVSAAVAVGLGTTLNPLGNERDGLSTALAVPGGHRTLLRGHALGAVLPGAPTVGTVAVVSGAVVGYEPVALLALTLVGVVLAVAGVGVSLGVGAFFPKLERPVDASLVPPALPAMGAFLATMVVLAAPVVASLEPGAFDGPPVHDPVVTLVATALVASVAGGLGYRYAVGALERYETAGASA